MHYLTVLMRLNNSQEHDPRMAVSPAEQRKRSEDYAAERERLNLQTDGSGWITHRHTKRIYWCIGMIVAADGTVCVYTSEGPDGWTYHRDRAADFTQTASCLLPLDDRVADEQASRILRTDDA